jgi:hypothetical protein
MLVVLQPYSLTYVDLDMTYANTNSAALSMAFERLSSLQHLRLTGNDVPRHDTSLGSALTALAQLSHLTSLELSGRWCSEVDCAQQSLVCGRVLAQPASVALQQLLTQPLPLQKLVLQLDFYLQVLNLVLLTKLKELNTVSFFASCVLAADSVLPTQLQRLGFHSWGSTTSLAPVTRLELQQLQHLSLTVDFTEQQPLLQLAQLPALQHLALQYDAFGSEQGHPTAATAPAWALLPQLRELTVEAR